MGGEIITDGLCIICSGLGLADEDDDGNVQGYTKTDHCLDNLKDLQRFLRRDDPQRRDVFKQICRWKTVSRDLIPIIEHCRSDTNLVINAVKILVFLTMPVDPASDDVAQQIEYLWDVKAAVTRNLTIAVIVSLLEEPLRNSESGAFTEDDWKLVQLILTLFRNILAIQGITVQQKASGSATRFLYLTEKLLEIMFHENAMDLILVLVQHVNDSDGYIRQINLLLLEVLHYILLGWDPELVAKTSSVNSKANENGATSAESIRSIGKEEEEKRRAIRQKNFDCCLQFDGRFTRVAMDGSKMLIKGNPSAASGTGLSIVRKVPRGPLKKIASDSGGASLREDNILELLHTFLNQFLSGGYNDLMKTIRDDITKELQDIQLNDINIFFQVAHFVTAFHHKRVLMKLGSDSTMLDSINGQTLEYFSSHHDLCGPVASTMNEAMYTLVISRWREVFEGVKITNEYKFLNAAASLMKSMIRMLDLVLKLLPEDSKECETARVMLYKLFYDQTDEGLTQFLLNLFKCFSSHKQPKSDLADLLEIIHVMLRLMEKLQTYGTLRVSRKLRRRTKKKASKDQTEVESRLIKESDSAHQFSSSTFENCADLGKSKCENVLDSDPTESKQGLHQDGILSFKPPFVSDTVSENTQHVQNHSSPLHVEENKNYADHEYETGDSSNNDQPTTNEVNFDISTLLFSFATNTVIHNLCWLLKHYKTNSASTNYYIISMMRRFCDDLELSPMFYQLSLLTTFHDILAEEKKCKCRDYMHIVNYLSKFVRELFKRMKSQPLLFVEILFWKTRRECEHINAEALMGDIVKLRNDMRNMDSDKKDSTNFHGDKGYRSIADALGEDEIDLDIPQMNHDQWMEQQRSADGKSNLLRTKLRKSKMSEANILENKIDNDTSEFTPNIPPVQGASRRCNHPSFTQEQVAIITGLYQKYKNEKKCSRLIADALDPDGKISPAQITGKLKDLGLIPKKRLVKADEHLPVMGDPDETQPDLQERENFTFPKTSTRKRVRAFSIEEELQITVLYEMFKNHKKRNIMIANVLDPKNKISAAEVSCKLKHLGLLPCKKSTSTSRKHAKDDEANDPQYNSDEETLLMLRKSGKKRNVGVRTVANISSQQLKEIPQGKDSGDVALSSLFKSNRKKQTVGVHGGANISSQRLKKTPQGNESDDLALSSLFKSSRKKQSIRVRSGANISSQQLKETPQGNDSDDVALSSLFINAAAKNTPKTPEHDTEAVEPETIQLAGRNNEHTSKIYGQQQLMSAGQDEDLLDFEDDLLDFEDDLLDFEDDLLPMAQKRMGSRRSLKMVVDFDEDD